MAEAAWRNYLLTVDEAEPEEAVLQAAEDFLFNKAKLKTPGACHSLTGDHLQKHTDFPEDLPTQAFLLRMMENMEAVRLAEKAARDLKRMGVATTAMATSGPAGSASSALGLAAAIAPFKACDALAQLKKANMEKLPFVQQLDQNFWDKMQTENTAASAESRAAYTYVDLTQCGVLPIWVYPEAVGGRSADNKVDAQLDPGAEVHNLAKLGAALRGVTENTRFFRSTTQWTAAYYRYAPTAVAMDQVSWVHILLHGDIISRIAEEERADKRPPYIAFLYDELLRRQVEKRAQKRDPDLDLVEVFGKVDKALLCVARQRLNAALKQAGMAGGTGSQATIATPGDLLQSHTARLMEAGREMQRQPERQPRTHPRKMPWQAEDAHGSGGGSAGSGEDVSKRKAKKHNWWQDKKQYWRDNKKHKR